MSDLHGTRHEKAQIGTERHGATCGERHGKARGVYRPRASVPTSRDVLDQKGQTRSASLASDLNAQAIIGKHGVKPGFRGVIVGPDHEPITVILINSIPRQSGGFWCIWADWRPRTALARLWPAWVTSTAQRPASPYDVWVERQAEVAELAGCKGPSPWGRVAGSVEPHRVTPQNQKNLRTILNWERK
jgi:hypothetical protein